MKHVYLTAFTGNLVTFSAGTALTWSSPEMSKMMDPTQSPFDGGITKLEAAWISTFLTVGCIFGPFLFGFLPDCIGRKYTLMATGVPLLISYLLLAFRKNVIDFYVARFIAGLSVGSIFIIIPNYISEITDTTNRGVLGSLMGVFLCLGIVFSCSLGPFCSVRVFNISLATVPFLFLLLFFFSGTESPQYYINKKQPFKAGAILQCLRGTNTNIEEELKMLQKKRSEVGSGSFLNIFRSNGLTKAFTMVVGQIIFQQLSGISAILFFSQSIFRSAGTNLNPAICSIIISCVQLSASFVTPLLIERAGRRFLLIFSSLGMLLALLPLGIYSFLKYHHYTSYISSVSFIPIPCLMVYIFAFATGFGSVPWLMMGELFPANVKYIASMVAATICWIVGVLVSRYFQIISESFGEGVCFFIFSAFCALSATFVHTFVIETKGKSLHDIHKELEH